jgi:hypothetical protein
MGYMPERVITLLDSEKWSVENPHIPTVKFFWLVPTVNFTLILNPQSSLSKLD